MFSSHCCFLSCIQVSQEADKVVWCSYLFKNTPQFVVIHIIKGFSIVNEVEVDVFLELPCFHHDPMNVGNLISGSSASLKPSCTSGSFQFTYCWSLAWSSLSVTLLACEMSTTVQQFEHSLSLPFTGIAIKTDIFQFCDYWWVFQIFWPSECSILTASSLRIWKTSTEILSPPLAWFVVMLEKAHLNSHSRMSGSRWVTTQSLLPVSLRPFLYISSVYSCHFLSSSASVRSLPFLSFI